MSKRLQNRHKQQGSMLLEALISILIFSVGILAIVALQANSIKLSGDAKYRSDANLMANQYIGLMWSDIAGAIIASNAGAAVPFSSTEFDTYDSVKSPGPNTAFSNWFASSVSPALPNASAVVTTNTQLTCGGNPCVGGETGMQQNTHTDVNINITWQLPGGDSHRYATSVAIGAQKNL